MASVRLALAQVNPTVGDLSANTKRVLRSLEQARDLGAELVAFPELVLTGYPPEDLLLKKSFVDDNLIALHDVARGARGMNVIVGFVDRDDRGIYNAAAVISDGELRRSYRKHRLPNYGVFDEERYFEPGDGIALLEISGAVIGLTICEDLWDRDGPHASCAAAGAGLIVNINGSPYHRGKGEERLDLLRKRSAETGCAFAYVNMVGGQDELVFDGQSMVVTSDGELIARATQFEEELLVADIEIGAGAGAAKQNEGVHIDRLAVHTSYRPEIDPRIASASDPLGEVYSALVLGVRDYLHKNGFAEALVGLSGGIDSSLTVAIAADAIGGANVLGVMNPTRFTSRRSIEGAQELARNLGIRTLTIDIDPIFQQALDSLAKELGEVEFSVAEENLQSRLRGMLWMAISNRSEGTGSRMIVLSTGNKSEMAVGYATLYGDMAGGFAVLKDVPKTLVYELAEWRNARREVIPRQIIERPPSAELRPDQLDTDSLPAYSVLDPILEAYVEDDRSIDEIVLMGLEEAVVRRVVGMVDKAEYKRRQAPPGIKITEKAFGRDRRLPITNRYRPSEL